jgi:hypothetical protein
MENGNNNDNNNEWKDAGPPTADYSNKGKTVIVLIAGGLLLGALAFIGAKVRPVGLAAGTFTFMTGLGMLMRRRRVKTDLRTTVFIILAGFLLLLSNPRFGIAAGVAVYFLIVGAIGLVVAGLGKAIKLSWDLGKRV